MSPPPPCKFTASGPPHLTLRSLHFCGASFLAGTAVEITSRQLCIALSVSSACRAHHTCRSRVLARIASASLPSVRKDIECALSSRVAQPLYRLCGLCGHACQRLPVEARALKVISWHRFAFPLSSRNSYGLRQMTTTGQQAGWSEETFRLAHETIRREVHAALQQLYLHVLREGLNAVGITSASQAHATRLLYDSKWPLPVSASTSCSHEGSVPDFEPAEDEDLPTWYFELTLNDSFNNWLDGILSTFLCARRILTH